MYTSPFQPPSPRQDVLAAQIEAARAADDGRRLLLLRSQWVHRFGVDTLPEPQAVQSLFGHHSSLIQEPTNKEPISKESTSTAFVAPAVDDAFGDMAFSDMAVSDEALSDEALSDEAVGEEAVSEEHPGDDVASVDAESDLEVAGTDAPTAEGMPVLHVALKQVPEPPLTTPRSLRRWLASDSESVPKAS